MVNESNGWIYLSIDESNGIESINLYSAKIEVASKLSKLFQQFCCWSVACCSPRSLPLDFTAVVDLVY